MNRLFKYHYIASFGLLLSAIAYAANPVDVTCSECGGGEWEFECFATHDDANTDWQYSADPGVGYYKFGHTSAGGYDLYSCPTGGTQGVRLIGTGHDSNHDDNGVDDHVVTCNP